MSGNGEHADETTFDDQLERLGFRVTGESRRGGRIWTLVFNRYLTLNLHDYHDEVVLSWVFAWGDFVEQRGWVMGSGETSFHELYPRRDVKLGATIADVEGEIRRVLASLRLDLADPSL